jgi:cobalt-zinc-cadmium efflux system protein
MHGHDHGHHDHAHSHEGEVGLRGAFFLNLGFAVVELVGGILTNSVAILSDAVHDFGDSFTLGVSWYLERYSSREPTDRQTFGYKRFSLMGALLSALVLLIGSVFILLEAVPRLWNPEEVNPEGMLPLAVVGITVNLIAALRLRGGKKLNQRVILLHLLEDLLGWVGVLVVSVILLFVDLPILDPILSIAITVFVLSRIIPHLRRTLRVFLQYAPDDIEIQEVKDRLSEMEEIKEVHDVHLWSLDGNYTLFSAHIVLTRDTDLSEQEEIKRRIKDVLKSMQIQHATLEFEPSVAACEECDIHP